jgi:hypothetical protein
MDSQVNPRVLFVRAVESIEASRKPGREPEQPADEDVKRGRVTERCTPQFERGNL